MTQKLSHDLVQWHVPLKLPSKGRIFKQERIFGAFKIHFKISLSLSFKISISLSLNVSSHGAAEDGRRTGRHGRNPARPPPNRTAPGITQTLDFYYRSKVSSFFDFHIHSVIYLNGSILFFLLEVGFSSYLENVLDFFPFLM